MKIVFLGTKGEIDKENSNHRNHSSILVISNSGQKLLVDVGVDRDWKIENIKPDYIVITHSHKDHIGGLKEEDPNCDIYATRLTFDTCTPSWIEHFKKENRLKILESEQTNTLGDFKITPIPVLHSVKHPMDILLIEVDNKRIIYAPDMRWIKKDKQEKYLKNIDVWIGDTSTIDKSITRRDKDTGEIYGHLSVRELLDILEENDIRHLILTHLGEEAVGMGDRELKEKIGDLVGDRDIKITVARDKMEISSKDLTVTTEDIITPKKIADIPEYTAGYILVSPHGTLIMKGEKTLVIKSKKYTEHINEPLLLIEDKKALGIIRLDEPEEITQEQFKQLREYHKITDEEADRWSFSKKDKLYSYHVSVLKQFSTPISVEYPRGAQVFIKPENIVLDLTLEDLILEHAKIHSKEEITDEDIEYHNYLVECFNRLEIPHPKGMRDTSYCILDRVDLIQDIGKYDPKKVDNLPLADDWRILCFPPDTLIWTNPTLSFISQPESKTILGSSGQSRILKTLSRDYDGELIKFRVAYLGEFATTPEHPILIVTIDHDRNSYVPRLGRYLGWKNTYGGRVSLGYKYEEQWIEARDLKPKRHGVKIPIPQKIIPSGLPDEIFSLAGWYLAEGFPASSGCIRFSLSPLEIEYAEEILQLAKRLGIKGSMKKLEKEIRINLYSKELRDFLVNNFGKGAKNKVIPQWVIDEEPRKIQLLLDCWRKGDGKKSHPFCVSTVSKKLVYSAFLCLLKLGKIGSISESTKETNFGSSIAYTITANPKLGQVIFRKDGYLILPIKKVWKEHYSGKVYNLVVDGDHTYCIPFIVHNCGWHSSIRRGKKIHVHEFGKKIELTPDKCVEFGEKIVEEIYRRVKAGKLKHTFRPKEMKKYARELYEKVKERLKKKGINLEEIEELAEWSIEKIDDRLVRSLSDKDLISLHDWLHEVANRELEEKGRISEETINAHIFVWKEMLERNIPHTIKDKLDRESELIVVEYPSPPKGLEKDKITLKEVLDAFPNTFTINDPPAHIFLVGRIVNEGEIPVDHDIDIVIKQRYPDPRLIKELERVLPDWLFKRLHFIYSPHGAMVGYNIPLYKLSYTRVSRDESLSKEKKITVGKPFKPMKTGTTFNKNEFFDPVMLWKNWGSEYIDDGIVIQPKYDGFRLQIHRAGDKIWIFTEDQLRDRAKYFKESVREMLQKFPEKDYIIDTELVDYPSECAEKYKTGKEIEQKCEQYQREDMIKWIVAKKGLDDRSVVFHIHDILYYDGEQLTDKPYIERLNLLKKLVPKGLRHWSLVESWIARDKDEFEEYLDKARYYPNSEGAMLKTANSTYKISYKSTPRTDLWCITGGSYLLTPKGFRKVKDLKIGDLVYSKDGKPHRIVAIQKRRMLPEERLFEVRTLSGLAIRLTGNHELLTTDSWIPVSEIGDRKSLFPKLEIYTEEPPKTLVLSWHGYKKKIECNEDFWRFLGFWVAEGWIGSSKTKEGNKGDIVVCQKDPSVLEKYSKIIERLFNVKPSLYKYKIALLRFWDLPFASWLSQHFLDESDRKTVPLFLAKLDDSKFKAFLEGYLEGDGWIESSSKRVGFSTSSSSLAGRLFLILQYRGFKVSVQKLKPRRGRGYFRFRFLKGEPDLTIKIREIYEKKTVYDLQIEGEDSYITPYLILHNSKIKNVKEIDVMVWKINKTKAGTYNYEAVIRIPPKEKDKWSDKFLVEIDGKWYLHIGRTYNTDVKCKEGDIITVSPIRIRVFRDEEGKKYLTWMFPIFRGKRIDKKEPDGLDTALRIAEAGTHPLSKTEIRIPLQRCPYFDNPEICPLYPLYSEGWRERERRIREQLSVKVETLRFPIRCNLANRYKCVYVKDYYYEYRDITDLPEYIEVSK